MRQGGTLENASRVLAFDVSGESVEKLGYQAAVLFISNRSTEKMPGCLEGEVCGCGLEILHGTLSFAVDLPARLVEHTPCFCLRLLGNRGTQAFTFGPTLFDNPGGFPIGLGQDTLVFGQETLGLLSSPLRFVK